MADPRHVALILEKLLRGCENTPAAAITRASLPRAEGPLPARLEQFLVKRIEHPERSAEADLVMSDIMQDFGARVFRQFLAWGLSRKECETDLAQNREDVRYAESLLTALACECTNTPMLPRATAELLKRVANALHEVGANRRATLFDIGLVRSPPPTCGVNTPGAQCEGRLAAALEILIRGGMKLAAAKDWLNAEMRTAGLVDRAGNQIRGARVATWRNNFQKGVGATQARIWFNAETGPRGALLAAPKDERKLAACQDLARRLVGMLAIHFNRTVAPPLKK